MLIRLIEYFFLFMIGAISGWVIELFYRKYFGKARTWCNPGFLSGPYLPIYGFGTLGLYSIGLIDIPIGYKIVICGLIATFLELASGLFFEKYYKIKLWDYREMKWNYKGVICPRYTFFWTILSLLFLLFLFPLFTELVKLFNTNMKYSFFVGILLGVLLVDLCNTMDLVKKVKQIANSEKLVPIQFERLKIDLREYLTSIDLTVLPKFLLPFRGHSHIADYKAFLNRNSSDSKK